MKIPFFKNKNPTVVTKISMITEQNSTFYSWNGNAYESDVIRACIRPCSKAVGKLQAKHISYQKGDIKVNNVPYIRMLLEEPNANMTGQMLLEKLASQLELNNNAFAYIHRDSNGLANEIYPINCSGAESLYKDYELFIKFNLTNGRTVIYPYRDIIHLRNDYSESDVFGSPYGQTLVSLMNVVNYTDQGIVNAIKNSAVIRWLLKYNVSLRDEDLKRNAENFSKNFLSSQETGTGVAAIDSKADAKQIEQNDYVPNAAQMDRTTNRIYNLFGINEKIIQSKYNEDDWNAFYESKIEPTAIQLGNEYTRKLFSRTERSFGNKIIFESSNLTTASMGTKLNLLQMVDRGAMTPNEWRQVLNLGPIEGGDKPIRRLDTAVVE